MKSGLKARNESKLNRNVLVSNKFTEISAMGFNLSAHVLRAQSFPASMLRTKTSRAKNI